MCLHGDERIPATIATDTLRRNKSVEILSLFHQTVNWDESSTFSGNIPIISSAGARCRNLDDVRPSIVKRRINTDAFANTNRDLILSGALEGLTNNLLEYGRSGGVLGVLEWVIIAGWI